MSLCIYILKIVNIVPLLFSQYLDSPTFNTVPLYTGGTIAISVVISSSLTLVIGIFIGLLVMYLCMRKKAPNSLTTEGQANVGPTAPAGPVYEEVSLREEIELNTNKAYGQVGL